VYRARVASLHEALRRDPDGRETLEAVRALIERVELTPAHAGKGFEIELIGEIGAMLRLGSGEKASDRRGAVRHDGASDRDLFESSVKVVAGTGFDRQLTLPTVLC
jgi:hypothetical protein